MHSEPTIGLKFISELDRMEPIQGEFYAGKSIWAILNLSTDDSDVEYITKSPNDLKKSL